MAFDSLGRYTASHKAYDHFGNLIPDIEHSKGERPHGEFKPAAWLPVQYWDKHFEEWFVVMPGKIVACDNDGRLIPAQYGLSGATITYTTNDVEAGVIDVRTGSALLSSATGTFTVASVSDFMGESDVAMTVSAPVGVAPYAYWQWGGDGSSYDTGFNPAGYRNHNHNLQHRTAILCDYVLELPKVPTTIANAEDLAYASYSDNVVTFSAVSNLPVAKNTVRTPITFGIGTLGDPGTRFSNEVSSVSAISTVGDWHINLTTGVISAYIGSDPGAGNLYTVTYSHYNSVPGTVSKFACAVGDLKAGDFVKCDSNSNFTEATAKVYGDGESDDFDTFSHIMGQVIEVEDLYDKDYLGRVRTAYDPALDTSATGTMYAGQAGYSGQLDQMPGSATGGVTDKIHYAGAANLVVRINLISR